MSKIELKIANPLKLEAGIMAPAEVWTYAGTSHPLVLDTNGCFIVCEALGKQATISHWQISTEGHEMKLASDSCVQGSFVEITQAMAASIGGQLVAKIGIPGLQQYLRTLDKAFSADFEEPIPKPQPAPKPKPQPAPKPEENPIPVKPEPEPEPAPNPVPKPEPTPAPQPVPNLSDWLNNSKPDASDSVYDDVRK